MDIKGWKDYLVVGTFAAAVAFAVAWISRPRIPAPDSTAPAYAEETARIAVAEWPEASRLNAEMMIERYGPPDRQTISQASWFSRSPWKRVVVSAFEAAAPLEETVSYNVRPGLAGDIAAVDHGVRAGADELTARSDREGLNILALNLANRVAEGSLSSRQAADDYAETARRAAAGKTSPLMKKLEFAPYAPPPPPLDRGLVY